MAGRQAQPGKGSQELCSCEKRLLALSAGQDAPCNLCNAERLQECSALHLRNLIHSLLTLIPHPAAGMGSLPQMGKPRHGAFCELELTTGKIQKSEQHLCCGHCLCCHPGLSPRAMLSWQQLEVSLCQACP